jgi:predicted lipoprotein with Yx(FWY)xxD motif
MMKVVILCILLALTTQKHHTIRAVESNAGEYITDGKGMPLYLYMDDSQYSGVSSCYELCAQIWPPLLVEPGQEPRGTSDLMNSKLSTLTRTDGTLQVVYNGWPLYHLSSDKIKENVGGQGLRDDNFWWAVSVEGNPITNVPVVTPRFEDSHEMKHHLEVNSNNVRIVHSNVGKYLTDPRGMPLYMYAADTQNSGLSVCYGVCAYYWPPLIVSAGAVLKGENDEVTAKLSTIIRNDNYLQVVYNGWPLYTFIGDILPENVGGQGLGDPLLWWVVSEEGNPITDADTIRPDFHQVDTTTTSSSLESTSSWDSSSSSSESDYSSSYSESDYSSSSSESDYSSSYSESDYSSSSSESDYSSSSDDSSSSDSSEERESRTYRELERSIERFMEESQHHHH